MNLLRASMMLLFALGLALPAAAKEEIRPSVDRNAAPAEALSAFDRVEVLPIAMGAPWAGQKPNEAARERLQANLDERLAPWVAAFNARAATSDPARLLRVEPRIEGIRFIGGGKRFFAGAFAGKSRVLLVLRLVDAQTGAVVAEPQFYQHAAGMAGAYSVGGADKAMLVRVAGLAADYLRANEADAVGSATGWVD